MKIKQKKIISHLIGGLGNQLFQYATSYALAKENNAKIVIDDRLFKKYKLHGGYRLDKLNIIGEKISSIDKLLFPLILCKLSQKENFIFKSTKKFILEKKTSSFKYLTFSDKEHTKMLIGYWQNAIYFQKYFSELKEMFVPLDISQEQLDLSIQIHAQQSVALHVRRGDYISNKNALAMHGICSIDYYKNSIQHINAKLEKPFFYIFSNDKLWCEENLTPLFDGNFHIVENNSQEIDLWLISQCQHHIIANSTFSWWGAWLANSDSQIVITPDPWFNKEIDIPSPVLSHWLKLKK
ncbi:alpha-1,2-fucosyltransferase [Providencia sp. wls1922]|nr:alpha-1,2-fucosyltransferase [Providencia sp. wls1922]